MGLVGMIPSRTATLRAVTSVHWWLKAVFGFRFCLVSGLQVFHKGNAELLADVPDLYLATVHLGQDGTYPVYSMDIMYTAATLYLLKTGKPLQYGYVLIRDTALRFHKPSVLGR